MFFGFIDCLKSIILFKIIYWINIFRIIKLISDKICYILNIQNKDILVGALVSISHAVIITLYSFNFIYDNYDEYLICDKSFADYNSIISVTLGYFVIDTIRILKLLNEKYDSFLMSMIFHHIMCTFGLFISYYMQAYQWIMIYGLFTEISAPFATIRMLLDTYLKNYNKLIIINGLAMWFLHGIFRVFLFNYYFYSNSFCVHSSTMVIIFFYSVTGIFACLNLYWYFLMCKGVYKKLIIRKD